MVMEFLSAFEYMLQMYKADDSSDFRKNIGGIRVNSCILKTKCLYHLGIDADIFYFQCIYECLT